MAKKTSDVPRMDGDAPREIAAPLSGMETMDLEGAIAKLTLEIEELTRTLHIKSEIVKKLNLLRLLQNPEDARKNYHLIGQHRARANGAFSQGTLAFLSRNKGKTFSSKEIAYKLAAEMGQVLLNEKDLASFRSSVTIALSRHAKKNLVELVGNRAHGEYLWRVPE